MKAHKHLRCQATQRSAFIYFGGLESGPEAQEQTSQKPTEGIDESPDQSGAKAKEKAAKMIEAGKNQPEQLSTNFEKAAKKAIGIMVDVDAKYFMRSVNTKNYSDPKKAYEQLLESCKKVKWLSDIAKKYEIKKGDKANAPSFEEYYPGHIAADIVDIIYDECGSKFFTRENDGSRTGDANEERGNEVIAWMYSDESVQKAKKVEKFFKEGGDIIRKALS